MGRSWFFQTALVALVAGVLLAPGSARGDLLSGTVRVEGGVAGGKGVRGELESEAFSEGARGGTYGARVGIEFLFLNLWIGHDQYVRSDGLVGTWTTLPMLGFDTQFDVGEQPAIPNGDRTKMVAGPSRWFATLGFGVGFGLGTGQQIDPPLDNSEITDKGFMFEVEAGIARRITSGLSIGLAVPVQYRIIFKNGADAVVNNPSDRYHSIAASALLNLRYKLKLL